jgi:hypothetical protein
MRELKDNELREIDGGAIKIGEVVVQGETIATVRKQGSLYIVESSSGNTRTYYGKEEYMEEYGWMVE